jgi:hypothetical protein
MGMNNEDWCKKNCPYNTDCSCDGVCNFVLSLLKEQEAVEPIPPTDESDLWKCGNCNHQLFRCTHQRYCEMCGRAVKWDDD